MTARRQLIIMRHAKAGELPAGPDFERTLRPRGRRDAAAAGRWLAGRGLVPDLVLCSGASRARQTWRCVSEELDGHPEVVFDDRLYGAGAGDLAGILAEADPGARTVMYVGHNPAAADLAVELPTSAIAVLGLPGPWRGLAGARAELVASWRPREAGS